MSIFSKKPFAFIYTTHKVELWGFFLKGGKENHSQLSEVPTYVRETTLFVPIKNHSHFTNIILK